jgi:aspartyl-tRNA(Asn)/glutamyl-tRNA(Gln) amidotransferase subunit A
MSNIAADLMKELHGLWPACKDDLTLEIAFGVEIAHQLFDLGMATKVEIERQLTNEMMADLFDEVDLVISLTNPDVAYPAEVTLNTRVGDRHVGPENNVALTVPANVVGNASVSIPIGLFDGLPVGMQVMGRHHSEPLLLDVGLLVERERPWPLVAPGSPC